MTSSADIRKLEAEYSAPWPFWWCHDAQLGRGDWIPGVRLGAIPPDDCYAIADAVGSVHYKVISTHKPGKYPDRVFYVRQFTRPDGERFGRKGLKVCTLKKFIKLTHGWLPEPKCPYIQGDGYKIEPSDQALPHIEKGEL